MSRDERIALFQKWIEALRSGEYPQARFNLKRDDGYCCLGVLCEVAGLSATRIEGVYCYGSKDDYAQLPGWLADDVGISPTGKLSERVTLRGDQVGQLTALNDRQMPFSFIADVIEEQFLRPLLEEVSHVG